MALRFEGAEQFRTRLCFAILSSRPMHIAKIRELDETPGVSDYEVCFAELVDKLTNGTSVTINSTGTSVSVTRTGYILGGVVEHACVGRGIGYFLEGVLPLCLFSKRAVRLTLTGITNDEVDTSVDIIKNVTARLVARFGMEVGPQLDIVQRGLAPYGKGKVVLTCPVVRELKAIHLLDPGFVSKVRGCAYGVRVSPQITNRMATAARGIFNELLPDVFISTDHVKGSALVDGLPSDPGYGLTIFVESTNGCVHGVQRAAIRQTVVDSKEGSKVVMREHKMLKVAHPGVAPVSDAEDVATNAAFQLLEEVDKGGCVDTTHQALLFTLMALCPEDVSKVRVGKLSPVAAKHLRLIKSFFGVMFKLKLDEGDETVVCSCVGVGYKNLSRKVT